MKIQVYILVFFLSILVSSIKGQVLDEIGIYNSLLDSLYKKDYCHKIIKLPYHKCCNILTYNTDSLIECCEQSGIPVQYRVYCTACIEESSLDSMRQLIVVNNPLKSLNWKSDKKYILSKISISSVFYKFLKDCVIDKKPLRYNVNDLKQSDIHFITDPTYKNGDKNYRFGSNGNDFFIGFLSLSRIVTNKEQSLGLFKYTYLGGGLCGYDKYILLYKENGKWKIFKQIKYGDY
jgi:hypothetical protein